MDGGAEDLGAKRSCCSAREGSAETVHANTLDHTTQNPSGCRVD